MENDFDIAIVGMAGRFPGARDLEEFWRNLEGGVESIARLSDADLASAGIAPEVYGRPDYVRAAPALEDPALFDAAFFGFAPAEAASLDPQHRLLLELSQVALDDAGCDPERFKGRIGVFAGSALNTYFFDRGLERHFAENYIPTLVATDKDFLSTRISYKLGLRGPSLTVQTACSTSLVAIHLARQSLLSEETDLALAGAVSVRVPHRAGYFYEGSGVVSPDGHVRAFDAAANGTVFGSGAGVIVLKRLADAVAQGDRIHAVIRGSAVNNDGAGKAGYTAPSVAGQAEAIVEALANAGVSADDLSYVEAHGSGTPVGDRIELLALSQAFRQFTDRRGYCALGSVKTNVGHLDAAAGMAGLIKTVLALKHRRIPATLHYASPNAEIDFPATPFFVSGRALEWKTAGSPRRAGVMATGMGGTNAYVVLEEAPVAKALAEPAAGPQLLIWSAQTPSALEALTARLAGEWDAPLGAVARTLQVGRRFLAQRRCLVARDEEDARRELGNPKSPRLITGAVRNDAESELLFLLPGIGDHYVGMGRGLYDRFPAFRAEIDRCAEILAPLMGIDLREILFPADFNPPPPAGAPGIDLKRMMGRAPDAARHPAEVRLDQTLYSQPALFAVEYALARLWMQWGVRPARLVGHSMGEYVAACLAGVFSLPDALGLIAARAKLVNELPRGAMAAVLLSEAEILPLLTSKISVSLINGPKLCVVAGPEAAMEEFCARLKARGIIFRPVRNAHAFHSRLLDPIIEPFVAAVKGVRLSAPAIPFISNVTGTWITDEQATDPRYWADHARRTSRFSDALERVAGLAGATIVEVGPGRTLGVLAAQHPAWPATNRPLVVASLRHSYENFSDVEVILGSVGRLWTQGLRIDWEQVGAGGAVRKTGLPAYPFERQRYWVEAAARRFPSEKSGGPPLPRPNLSDWFYTPTWRRTHRLSAVPAARAQGLYLIIAATAEEAGDWLSRFAALGAAAFVAVLGRELRTGNLEDYLRVVDAMERRAPAGGGGWNIVHLGAANGADLDLDAGFFSLLLLAQALGERNVSRPIKLAVVTAETHEVTGDETLNPAGATAVGICGVIGKELPNVTAFAVDRPGGKSDPAQILAEFERGASGAVIALRGKYRWERGFEPRPLPPAAGLGGLRQHGVYVIFGGTGGIGLAIAQDLAKACSARLVLLKRAAAGSGDARVTAALAAIAAAGGEAEVRVCDVTDRAAVRRVIVETMGRHGAIHGVIHAAGILRDGVMQLKTREVAQAVLRPKVEGTRAIYEAVKDLPLDFLALFSSISSVIAHHGQSDYAAANAYLDAFAAFAGSRQAFRTVAVNWATWRDVGIFTALKPLAGQEGRAQAVRERAMSTADGLEAFRRVLAASLTQVVVSPRDLAEAENPPVELTAAPADASRRREISDPPEDEVEITVAEIWSSALGLGPVGRRENFLELGGHSLLAMRIVARIRTQYQIDFTLRKFFENPTVAQTALLIQGEIVAELEALSDEEAAQRVS